MTRLFLIRHGEPEAAWGGAVDKTRPRKRGRAQAADAAVALLGGDPGNCVVAYAALPGDRRTVLSAKPQAAHCGATCQ